MIKNFHSCLVVPQFYLLYFKKKKKNTVGNVVVLMCYKMHLLIIIIYFFKEGTKEGLLNMVLINRVMDSHTFSYRGSNSGASQRYINSD